MRRYLKLACISLGSIVIIAAVSIVYGFIAHGRFTLRYIFDANFIVGALVIVTGMWVMFAPSNIMPKGVRLFDRATVIERSFDAREARQLKARDILWIGIFNVVLAGLIQLLLSAII